MDFGSLPIFDTNTLRIVCMSDTHEDNPAALIPDGDIFIHAGDMTDYGNVAEFTTVLKWVQDLPHKVKILIAGNGDATLDNPYSQQNARLQNLKTDKIRNRFNPEALALFTSPDMRAKGIHYLDREVRTVAYYRVRGSDTLRELNIYGNPLMPEFSPNRWPFTYPPHKSPEADEAWSKAPTAQDTVPIWVTHSPPLDRLDIANVAGFSGCAVLAEKIAAARPSLCVFGHFHYSWGVERVKWCREDSGVLEAQILTLSEERKKGEGVEGLETKTIFDFSDSGAEGRLQTREETVYVNAAWMTTKKTRVQVRNMPIVVTLTL
ncbi:hypothetical protein BP6252_13688 [Coleophoma cylindrospora]|uniref:Calcineurin-like phosphoesterase domain-containing protein n=1 Tax=Coleophoma cylindrospora TaxID=1849047 RepID=A0A3D8Q6Z7_9HELO|nr:hypothetical protein BP6252_13688 [Coleophoma cylindrospora]